jgi:hypothetical protein
MGMYDTLHSNVNDGQYFASKPAEQTAGILLNKSVSFFTLLTANNYLVKLENMWRAYYGAYRNDLGYGHTINFTGEQGELSNLPVNHFRNIAQHIYVMITSTRPVMDARAINTDYKSQAQTILANGILDYYMREKKLEGALKKAVEMAVVIGAGYIKLEWNATAGEIYDADPDTGEFNYEGEIEFTNLSPFDVIMDGTKESWSNDWLLVRSFKNRFDLMAKYPELANRIKQVPSKSDTSIYRLGVFSNDETDDIPVFEFFHRKTEAMPNGRYLLFVASDIILLDAPLPYRTIPIFRIAANDIMGTPYGYTPMFDIYPLQEAINALASSIMTNQNAFAVQNLWVPRGADIAVNQLEGAMNVIEGNIKPEPLNLVQTPDEIFKFYDMMVSSAETISGVNSVARGNPEASLKSGTALALVQSMALQFMSGLQQSYVELIEQVGSALIQILKDFAMTPKIVALVGKNNKYLLKEFTGEDINAINRVVVDMGNPLAKTIAGRVQMAEQMLQMHLIKTPEQYFQVMNTGRIDVTFQSDLDQLILIQRENEELSQGNKVTTAPTDRHSVHINEHAGVLNDPTLREDQQLVSVVMNHIQEHLNFLRDTDPALLALVGEHPLPPLGASPPAPPGAPPTPGANGPMPQTMAPPQGLPMAGTPISGPGQPNPVNLPHPASPAQPFQHLPTNPMQTAPPVAR